MTEAHLGSGFQPPPPPGLYVHLPFCVSKCPYCDFYSITDRSRRRELVEAVCSEGSSTFITPKPRRRRTSTFGERGFDTLYVGGGTPSCLELELLEELVTSLESTVSFAEDREWTIELNPEDVTSELLRGLRELGFGRISLGIQSFDDGELQFLGRRHSSRKAIEAIGTARVVGFENLSLDLMYGLSVEQTMECWTASLERALEFEPEHLSCYMLTLAPNTPLYDLASSREKLTLPSEGTLADLFRFTSDFLSERGFEHYEVSNFSRGSDLRSRHNQKYWRHVPYLGLGPAAHSFDGGRRWWNIGSVDDYVDRVGRRQPPKEEHEDLTKEQLRLEALYLGLRTSDGVSLEVVREIDGWERVVADLEAEGLILQVAGERLVPTLDGLLMSDGLSLRFFTES